MSIEVLSGPRSLRFAEEGRTISETELASAIWRVLSTANMEDAKAVAAEIFDSIEDLGLAYREVDRLDGELVAKAEEINQLETVNKVLKEELEQVKLAPINEKLTPALPPRPERHWNVGPYNPAVYGIHTADSSSGFHIFPTSMNAQISIPQADGGER